MEFGYSSTRFIEKRYDTDIRFIWTLDEEETPSHMTISNFINNELSSSLDEIFNDINRYTFSQQNVDLNHAYIDGTKLEANAQKYTWVWKKSSIQAEGTFGTINWNMGYKLLRRRGLKGVILELCLIFCGFNLHKYHAKRMAAQTAA